LNIESNEAKIEQKKTMTNHTNTIATIEKSTQFEKRVSFKYNGMDFVYSIYKQNNPEIFESIKEGLEINFDLGVMRNLFNVKING
jgi:predicted choloylglycine hydrolase